MRRCGEQFRNDSRESLCEHVEVGEDCLVVINKLHKLCEVRCVRWVRN
jgi:hypothetical protein